MFKIMAPYFPY